MFAIALKKWFFDVWDHLTSVVLSNLALTFVALLSTFAVVYAQNLLLAPALILVIAALVPFVNVMASTFVNGGTLSREAAFAHGKSAWLRWVLLSVFSMLLGAGILWGVPFYFAWNLVAGIAVSTVLTWVALFFLCMGVFFPGLFSRTSIALDVLLRQSFLAFAAGPISTLAFAAVALVMTALSFVTLGFFPGLSGILIWLQIAHRFQSAKLRWIAEHPKADRSQVPWKDLLAEDLDKMANRTIKSLIFPWK